ncbi:hypothetical protein [Lentibacillus sp. CBA3610]|uniref:hypothetical protein n=1 Tax=Lentibacillus sp. CBA3610 TaxID=2518176 RepID=UPI0015958D59|nr:hypothetical protein [Lentibacillus sp. CBA3610]QKY68823.1 hypothetical protein Len3610_03605 [Lentibacillus sp. CBA3610]
MRALIRRELEGMVTISIKRSLQTYIVFGLVLILLMWLLGPNIIGYLATDLISLFIFLIGMLAAGVSMLSVMEDDAASRQAGISANITVRNRHRSCEVFLVRSYCAVSICLGYLHLFSANFAHK